MAGEIGRAGRDEAAGGKGDGLRGPPEPHPRAFARRAPGPGELHHRADGGDRKGAVGHAEPENAEAHHRQRCQHAACRQAEKGARGAEAAAHGPERHRAEAPAREHAAGAGHDEHADEQPGMLDSREFREAPGVSAKTKPPNGSRISSCAE